MFPPVMWLAVAGLVGAVVGAGLTVALQGKADSNAIAGTALEVAQNLWTLAVSGLIAAVVFFVISGAFR